MLIGAIGGMGEIADAGVGREVGGLEGALGEALFWSSVFAQVVRLVGSL